MTISSGSMRAAVAAAAAVLVALSDGARAACPDTPCDCVGGASAYRIVADRLFDFDSVFYGNLCTRTAQLAEPNEDGPPEDIVGDLHALAGAGSVAVRGRIARQGPGDEIVVAGALATGGGDVSGPISAGTLDTTGNHPGIAACDQAMDDIVAGSQMLAALTPTQTLPRLIVDHPGVTEFPVGPGVNVIQIDGRMVLRNEANLHIVLDPGTDAVVFNTRAFSMRRFSRIFVVGGDATKVMINVAGSGPSVVATSDTWITPAIFAPERTVRIKGARFAALFGERVVLRQATTDFVTCPSPSGAFLDPPDLL